MATYRVCGVYEQKFDFEVEAETSHEAWEKARDEWNDNVYDSGLNIQDVYKIEK